jgi:hypothetical protein
VRRSWFIAAIVIGVAAIVIAALAARLTDDDGGQPSATDWADSVCASLADWHSSITSLADVSAGELTPESLEEKLDAAGDATSELIAELKALGPPDLEAGDDLKQELDADAAELQSSYEVLKQGVEEAADAGPTEFLQQLAALAPQFQALLDAVSGTVDDLRNADVGEDAKAELEQAFAEAESCQELEADR